MKRYGVFVNAQHTSNPVPAVKVYGKDNSGKATESGYVEPQKKPY